jgi:hypothetical protein
MWYKLAIKYNMFGLPISGDKKFKFFADEDEEEMEVQETPLEEPIQQEEPENPLDITIEDPSNDGEFTPEDLNQNVEKIENDPTALIQLPPLHDRCHCVIETLPILSMPGIRDGKRVWRKSENCCPKCYETSLKFNDAEIQRLLSKGIDINRIPR